MSKKTAYVVFRCPLDCISYIDIIFFKKNLVNCENILVFMVQPFFHWPMLTQAKQYQFWLKNHCFKKLYKVKSTKLTVCQHLFTQSWNDAGNLNEFMVNRHLRLTYVPHSYEATGITREIQILTLVQRT